MPTVENVIRTITVQGDPRGLDQLQNSLNQVAASQQKVVAASEQLRVTMDAASAAMTQNVANLNQVKGANDNAANSYLDTANKAKEFSSSLASTAENLLNTVNHLKLLAVAAYALSPAFRSLTNAGVSTAFKEIPLVANVTASAVTKLAPVLAFFGQITAPIAAAVLAWDGFNYVVKQGSDLLDKFSTYERSFFGADVDAELTKLTKFQDSTVTLQQAQYATELAARLAEAKQTINDFWRIQVDVTDLALRLQNAWVLIVEQIAKGASLLDRMSQSAPGVLAVLAQGIPVLGSLISAATLAYNSLGSNGTQSTEDLRKLGIAKLSAAMGGGFTGRFTGDIDALSKKPEDTTKDTSANAYDRFKDSIDTTTQSLKLQAEGADKASAAVEELKVAHEGYVAATKAAIPITDDMRASWKASADQIAALNIQIKQTKTLQDETFKTQTMFMSPADAAAAQAAHGIDPNDWQAHLNDAGVQQAKFNSQLSQGRDLAVNFADSIGEAALNGKRGFDLLSSAVTSFETALLKLVTSNAVNALFGSASGGGSSGGFFGALASLFSGGGGALPGSTPVGAGGIGHAHTGGVIGTDWLASKFVHPAYFENAPRYHSGGIAGDEVPIIARRGEGVFTPGQMAAMGGGKGVNVIVQNNHPGAAVSVGQKKNDDGGFDPVIMIKSVVNDHLASGGADGIMRGRFGVPLRPRPR